MNSGVVQAHHPMRRKAAIKRQLLAWYLDFLFFSVTSTLASYAAHWAYGNTWLGQLVGFSAVRGIGAFFIETPGMMILGIRRDGTRDERSFENENWLTMLVGTAFILDGAKQAVRWTEYVRTLPEFGIVPDPAGQMVFSLFWGASLMAAGMMVLQMRRAGLWFALFVTGATIVSLVLSWSLWDQAIVHEVIGRRAVQGIGVRPGEIEFMQKVLPISLLLVNGALLGLLIGVRRRFQM